MPGVSQASPRRKKLAQLSENSIITRRCSRTYRKIQQIVPLLAETRRQPRTTTLGGRPGTVPGKVHLTGPHDLRKHWGETGGTPVVKDKEIWVRTGNFKFAGTRKRDGANGVSSNGCVENTGF